jgi:hypothetical protein
VTASYTGTLNAAHLDRIHAARDEWMTTALATHQPDRDTATAAVRHLYDTHGLPAPLLTIWMDSPLGCIYAATVINQLGDQLRGQLRDQLRDQLGDQLWGQLWDQLGDQLWDQLGDQLRGQLGDQLRDQLGDQLRGQLGDQLRGWINKSFYPWNDAYWLAFYDCALPIAGLPPSPKLAALANAITELGWWIPMRGAVIMSGRPSALHRDADGQLHCPDGPAIAYPDGWGFHAWHGRRVEPWVIEEPTVERIAAEGNVEVRRCAIEAIGWGRFTELAGLVPVGQVPGSSHRSTELASARVPDPGNPGQHLTLYDVPERLWGDRIRLLMCTNGSAERDGTRRQYGLTVPAHITDPLEAAAWTVGLTGDQYARTQRRT